MATTCHVSALFRWFEDNLARQQTCHVIQTVTMQIVVTVHLNSGKPPLSLSFIHTRTRGHVAIGDKGPQNNAATTHHHHQLLTTTTNHDDHPLPVNDHPPPLTTHNWD